VTSLLLLVTMLKLLPARGEADVKDRLALAEAIHAATPDADEQSLLVAVALRESSFQPGARGDLREGKATSFCAFQLHLPGGAKTREGWTGEEVAADLTKCTTAALRKVRESQRICGALPREERLAVYAAGRCDSEAGKRLSRDRVGLSKHVRSIALRAKESEAPKVALGAR
jgi:hypothetical protein